MRNNIKTIVALSLICAVVSALLALGNAVTAPIIEKNESAAANEALKVVMPDGEGFELVDTQKEGYVLPATIGEVYSEKSGGYVFKITTTGYSSGFVIMCGIDKDGVVTGTQVIASGETLGYEYTYGEKLVGTTLEKVDSIDTVASATKTTSAYKGAVKDALNAFVIMGGGSVDLRTDEEILNDNLSAALAEAEGKFTEVFISEKVVTISALYKADNGKGFVAVSGESFIALDNDGNVLSVVDEQFKAAVSADAKPLILSTVTEIDLTKYQNMPSQVQKAYLTSSGNYIFELRAAGYGINGNKWDRSDEYIYIKASATAEGEIIFVKTTSQKESAGVGDACADEKFYVQFSGKNETNYGEIDAISGATVTTSGYKTAISKIFVAIKIIKGEA